MNRSKYKGNPIQPWAIEWMSPRALSMSGASSIRWQLLMALAAKKERAGR